ncbi:hypothetical protein [Niallia sp.]|uniref:hypothetical protein n=1 Tax=Niallia sp. TaxID=2837523 RepID=UPI00289D1E0B|nr:hypothetical protein [Niallia sp.]
MMIVSIKLACILQVKEYTMLLISKLEMVTTIMFSILLKKLNNYSYKEELWFLN